MAHFKNDKGFGPSKQPVNARFFSGSAHLNKMRIQIAGLLSQAAHANISAKAAPTSISDSAKFPGWEIKGNTIVSVTTSHNIAESYGHEMKRVLSQSQFRDFDRDMIKTTSDGPGKSHLSINIELLNSFTEKNAKTLPYSVTQVSLEEKTRNLLRQLENTITTLTARPTKAGYALI